VKSIGFKHGGSLRICVLHVLQENSGSEIRLVGNRDVIVDLNLDPGQPIDPTRTGPGLPIKPRKYPVFSWTGMDMCLHYIGQKVC
jgi:hypothetical protein